MTDGPALRWDNYFMASCEDFDEFWRKLLEGEGRSLLYIVGRGFDPRMNLGIERLLSLGAADRLHVILVDYDEGWSSPSQEYNQRVDCNAGVLRQLLEGKATMETKAVTMWVQDGPSRRRISSIESAKIVSSGADVDGFTDIVVDIGALPRSIYLSLIGKLMHLIRDRSSMRVLNLHVIVAEDSHLDSEIVEVGIDERADYIHGFSGGLDLEATGETPMVFMPILGEGQRDQLVAIYERIAPVEICPILPFPSRDPRRGDNLIIEYRDLLFDQWRIEPRNIIYASEFNPFDAYRQICHSALRYTKVLQPLGGCRVALAALSSKLISMGALLSAYELGDKGLSVGLANIEAEGYRLSMKDGLENPSLFSLWLMGECYE